MVVRSFAPLVLPAARVVARVVLPIVAHVLQELLLAQVAHVRDGLTAVLLRV